MSQTFVILHRWPNQFMQFQNLIDHKANRVIYFCTEGGKQGIESYIDQATDVVVFEDLTDLDELRKHCREVIDRHGGIDRIIAMSEYDLAPAAQLRTEFGVTGTQAHQVVLYKDKVEMKKRMKRDNLRAPEFFDCQNADEIRQFAQKIGYPLILKPKTGASSHGVVLVRSEDELEKALPTIDFDDYECEEYIEGPIFHIDGLTHKGELIFSSVCRYFNTCLAFLDGVPTGSILEDDQARVAQLTAFAADVVKSLELHNSAFHLEVIMKNGVEPVFLEIGARISGGELAFMVEDLYGVHLGEEWLKIELGLFQGLNVEQKYPCGGFVLIPEPRDVPVEVIHAPSMVDQIDEMINEILPQPGDILDGNGGYLKISGRFMFRGENGAQIEQAFQKTIDRFKLEYKPLSSVKS